MQAEPRDPSREQVTIRFSSALPPEYRDELERIVFFNPDQSRVKESLAAAVGQYGAPSIVQDGECLRFTVPAFGPVQSLYAFDDSASPARLVGVVMFVRDRDSPDTMLILHLAAHEDYAGNGSNASQMVGLRLMATVRSLSLHTRGIGFLRVLYPSGHRIPLRQTRSATAR